MADVELITKVKNNDKNAFKILFDSYRPNVYRTAFLILKNHQTVDDVVQETFMQVFLKINKLKNPAAFEKWLYKIVVNLCFQVIRRNGKVEITSYDEEVDKEVSCSNGEIFSPDNVIIQKETQEKIIEGINCLQIKHRTVVVLYYFDNFTINEMADIIGCSRGTVKSRLFYGKKILKDTLIKNNCDIFCENHGGMLNEV